MRLRRHSIILFAIIGLSLLLRGATYVAFLQTALPWFPEEAAQTDMHATWQWSGQILAGDLLGRETYHPEFQWMQNAGQREEWAKRWGDIRIFQQEPLYTYFVAALRWLFPAPLRTLPLIQLVLGGALLPLGVYLLGRQLVGRGAGLYAAGVAAVFGPAIFYQCAVLRDWTIPIGSAFFLAFAIAAIRQFRLGWIFAAGVLLGIGVMMKATALLWLPVLLGWWWWAAKKHPVQARFGKGAAVLVLGLVVGLSPLLVRNGIVGAPLLALSNRGPEGLIQGNAADANPVGLSSPASQDATLKGAGGSSLKVVGEILRGYWASPGDFSRVQGAKLRAAFAPVDIADNFSYDYGLLRLPVLRFCPSWGLLLALGIPGVVFLLVKRRGRALWIGGILAANAVAVLLPIALGRYRLEALPLLAIGAGQMLRLGVIELRRRRWTSLALGAGGVVGLGLLCQWMWPPAWLPWDLRQSLQIVERGASIYIYSEQHRYEEAADEAAELSARAALFPGGREEEVRARQSEIVSLVLGTLKAAEAGDRPQATSFFERARQRVQNGVTAKLLTPRDVALVLAQNFPREMAEQLTGMLFSASPIEFAPAS